jgi:tetratricopeptide (TPR) repeat protein
MPRRRRAQHEAQEARASDAGRPGTSPSPRARPPLVRPWIVVVGLAAVVAGAVWWGIRAADEARKRAVLSALEPVASSLPADQPEKQEALELADRLLREYPESPEALYARGLLLCRFGRNDEAVKNWNACLLLTSEPAPVYETLGSDALRRGDNRRAVELLRKALELDPNLPDATTYLGEALLNLGRFDEAVPVLQRAVGAAPRAADAYCRLAQAYLSLEAYARAKETYLAALREDPAFHNAYYGLAAACEGLGEPREAQEYREKHHAWMQKNRLTAQERARQSQTRDRAEVRGSLAWAYFTVAQVYETQGETQKARQCRDKAAALAPEHAMPVVPHGDRFRPEQSPATPDR